MTVLHYNGMLGVFLTTSGGTVAVGLPATVWDTEEGGTQILTVTDEYGGTGGTVKSGPVGRMKFTVAYTDGQEVPTVWLDFGVGGRWPLAAWDGRVTTTDLAAALANALAGTVGVVTHGATAGTTRPGGYAAIMWIGTVTPTNGDPAKDIWLDLS